VGLFFRTDPFQSKKKRTVTKEILGLARTWAGGWISVYLFSSEVRGRIYLGWALSASKTKRIATREVQGGWIAGPGGNIFKMI